jgi:hypothetical protein
MFGQTILAGIAAGSIHFTMLSNSIYEYSKDIHTPRLSLQALGACAVLYVTVILPISRFLTVLLFLFALSGLGAHFTNTVSWLTARY